MRVCDVDVRNAAQNLLIPLFDAAVDVLMRLHGLQPKARQTCDTSMKRNRNITEQPEIVVFTLASVIFATDDFPAFFEDWRARVPVLSLRRQREQVRAQAAA